MKNFKSSNTFFIIMISILLLVLPDAGDTQIPQTVSYQGYLTDAGTGDPVDTAGGTLDVQFSIYNVLSGGSALWTDMQAVTVSQGVYSVTFSGLGGLAFDAQYYLEVAVDEDSSGTIEAAEILTPREPFTAVPYALNAERVDGQDASDFAASVHNHAGSDITSGTVAEAQIDPAIARDAELTWGNLSGIPAGFVDDVDNDTTYSAGTGLDLTGTTFSVLVPLNLSGSLSNEGLLSGTNSNSNGRGVYGEANGGSGTGVWGETSGINGRGVVGNASNSGDGNNIGGWFYAHGTTGRGVNAEASGTNGIGVWGRAANSSDVSNIGVYGQADGTYGIGVYGGAGASVGTNGNYGGWFEANGGAGWGVYAKSHGTNGIGIYGHALNGGVGGYFNSEGGYGLIVQNGNVGIGTTSPSGTLEVARDQVPTGILATGYRDLFSAGVFTGRKARGTMASPTAVQTDDILATFGGYGYGTNGWPAAGNTAVKARMQIVAAQNWTDTAQGAYINFITTPIGSTSRSEAMRISDSGKVGIGTTSPQSELQVNGYTQLALTSGAPPSADCDSASERGRMKVDNAAGLLYICVDSGWLSK